MMTGACNGVKLRTYGKGRDIIGSTVSYAGLGGDAFGASVSISAELSRASKAC